MTATDHLLFLRLPVPVTCGNGRHDVVIEVTAWGSAEIVFNPCDVLPMTALRLSSSDCSPAVSAIRQSCLFVMQCVWLEPDAFAAAMDEFSVDLHPHLLAFARMVRQHKHDIARGILPCSSGWPSTARLWQALESADDSLRWAAVVLGDLDTTERPALVQAALDQCVGWPVGLQVAALCGVNVDMEPARLQRQAMCLHDDRLLSCLRVRFAEALKTKGNVLHARHLVQAVDKPDVARALSATAADALVAIIGRAVTGDAEPPGLGPLLLDLLKRSDGSECLANVLIRTADALFPRLEEIVNSTLSGTMARCAAARIVGTVADERPGPLLFQLVRFSDDPRLVQVCSDVIRTMGVRLIRLAERAIPFLCDLIRYGDGALVAYALDTLRQIEVPSAVDVIVRETKSTTSAGIRTAALESLGRITSWEVVPPLIAAFESTDDNSSCEIAGDSLASVLDRLSVDATRIRILRRLRACSYSPVAEASRRLLVAWNASEKVGRKAPEKLQ